jgi:dihydroflavonol-4-reductase
MKVLVTGATGLLGNHVARELVRQGHHVKLLVRPASDLRGIADLSATLAYGTLSDEPAIRKAVEGVDGVIHSAAATATGNTAFSYYEDANLTGTVRLVEAMQEAGCRRLVFVSTANTLGPGSVRVPGNESSPFALQSYGSGYVDTKYRAERFVLKNNGKKGLEAVVVNPTFMIGSHDFKPSSGQLILHALKKIQICPPGGKNFVYVRDAAAGTCAALFCGRAGRQYLLAGENLTYTAFFDLVNRLAGHSPYQLVIPKKIFHGAGLVGSALAKLTGRSIPFNYVNARLLALDNYYSGARAREELGMPFTPIATAITEALQWFRANGYVNRRGGGNCRKEDGRRSTTISID